MMWPTGAHYAISVQTQPNGLTCAVSNGSGTVADAPVTNLVVTCAASAFTVGGSVNGLTTTGLVLTNGSDSLAVLANADAVQHAAGPAQRGQLRGELLARIRRRATAVSPMAAASSAAPT